MCQKEEDDIVSKEGMWKSFSCKSDIKVGRELFLITLGWRYLVWSTRMWFRLSESAGECGHLILSELDSELCKMLIEIFVTFLVTAERVIFDKV